MASFSLGLVLIIIASICNAGFALPLTYTKVWRWENTWLSYSLVSLIILPWLLVLCFVSRSTELFASLSLRICLPAIGFGFLWGIAQAAFGVAIRMLGIGIALPVIGAIGIVLGSLIPILVQHPHALLGKLGTVLLLSCLLLVAGLVFYSRALRERDYATAVNTTFRGLLLCAFTGVIAGFLNLGFAFSGGIIQRAQALGNSPLVSTYPVWALVLMAGFLPNLGYCMYLMVANSTSILLIGHRVGGDFLFSVVMGVAWVAATFTYGAATQFVGRYGTTIGYLMYGAFTILFANVLGWLVGEWRGVMPQTVRSLWVGMALVLSSVGILALAS